MRRLAGGLSSDRRRQDMFVGGDCGAGLSAGAGGGGRDGGGESSASSSSSSSGESVAVGGG